jgi:2-polyprenyl-3-methyl-5-hydroxy-6-metoxy-1,4-benzoquinol methylase
VEVARQKGLDVCTGDLFEQAFPSDHFDAIYMSHLIEHVYDPFALLKECARILKPGGTLVVVTPNLASWGHRYFGANWPGLHQPRHLVMFSLRTLRLAIERGGLSVAQARSSARIAWMMWLGGTDLRNLGRVEKQIHPLHLLAAILYQVLEQALMHVRPDAGEEIVLIARKPANGERTPIASTGKHSVEP